MKRLAIAPILAIFLAPNLAAAQETKVNVTLTSEGQQLSSVLSMSDSDLAEMIGDAVSKLYGLTDLDDLLKRSANAQSFSNRGLGVDYASNPELFVFGLGVGATRSIDNTFTIEGKDKDYETALPVEGAQVTAMAGMNLKAVPGLDLPLTLSLNLLSFNVDPPGEDWKVKTRSFGVHAQYQVLPGFGTNWVFNWGGLFVTSGYEYSLLQFNIKGTLDYDTPLGPNDITLKTKSTGDAEVAQIAKTIPLEVSSNITVAYFLTFYGVLGMDFQFGESSLRANLHTDIDDTYTNARSATAEIVTSKSQKASSVLGHGMFGLQINASVFKIFGQIAYATNAEWALAAGLRVAY